MHSPNHEDVKKARKDAGLTQRQAGEMCGVDIRVFRRWEDGDSRMPYAAWQWFTLRTNQNPDWFVVSRKALIGPTL